MEIPIHTSSEQPSELYRDVIERAGSAYKKKEKSSDYQKKLTEILVAKEKSLQNLRDQIVNYRKCLFNFLLILMAFETVAMFVLVIVASLPSKILVIHDTTLQVLVGATIAQVSAMIIVIIRSVYSEGLNKFIMSNDSNRN